MTTRGMLLCLCALLLPAVAPAADYRPPPPGSPAALSDWRWLARPLVGKPTVIADMAGKRQLEPAPEGGFLLLKVDGPGVLDHFISSDGAALFTIEVDGRVFWQGKLDEALAAAEKEGGLFPKPIAFGGGPFRELIAPIGFRVGLRILTDKGACTHHLSYRMLPPGTAVATPAAADYATGLAAAAQAWRQGTWDWQAPSPDGGLRREFILQAGGRVTALESEGSGEVTHLEFHFNPALTGTLRHVLLEISYDDHKEAALRMPITDFVGQPHPWPTGRWGFSLQTIAAGLRLPWFIHTPRVYYPEATFHSNLPMPFARGLRLSLVNRSPDVRFAGYTLARVEPLTEAQAQAAGRLCGTRLLAPVTPGPDPQSLLEIPGPGQLVGLGLHLTGNATFPVAARTSLASLAVDDQPPIVGAGVVPIWLLGAYGGPLTSPLWSHVRMEDQYCGVVRHFLTDPVPFSKKAVFGYTPGSPSEGMPTDATVLALWYRFGDTPYVAPAQPPQAEALPYSRYGTQGASRGSRMVWGMEAEDLVLLAVAHGGEVRAIEDTEHNYHPSAGKYLQVNSDQVGDYVDCTVPFPASRYVAVGTVSLWGPNRSAYELDLLSKDDAQFPPGFAQGLDAIRGRAVGGGVEMKAPIMTGDWLIHFRDSSTEYPVPFLNPAPDGEGVLRFICRVKSYSANSLLMKLDQMRMDMPPPTPAGWREFEDEAAPEKTGELLASLPKYGRFTWSGWGALELVSSLGGQATISMLLPAGPAAPTELRVKGCLGPGQGGWSVSVNGGAPVSLAPGKDDKEVVEWTVPVQGVTLPGTIMLQVRCTALGEKTPEQRQAPPAQVALDCWTLK